MKHLHKSTQSSIMRIVALLISLSYLVFLTHNAVAEENENIPLTVKSADQLLEQFFADTQNLTADFSQITLDENGQQIEEQQAVGLFVLERPGKFRWHSIRPTELILLADGKNFWNYDVELEQVIVKPIDQSLSNTPAMLLSGQSDVLQAFDFGATFGTTLDIGSLQWVQLTPKDKNSDFSRLSIGFLGDNIRLMEFSTNVGQVIRVELTNVQVNTELKETVFALDVPEDVDVIGTPL